MSENERLVGDMGVRDEEAAVLVGILNRLDALEGWADQFKGGQTPPDPTNPKAKK